MVDELFSNSSSDSSFILLNYWVCCASVTIRLIFCETLRLLRSPTNATRLTTALERSKTEMIQHQNLSELCKEFRFEEDDIDHNLVSVG